MLEAGLWTLDPASWTLNAGLWTLDTTVGFFRTETEPSFWFCLSYWKLFGWESLRTSWSRLFGRGSRFWCGNDKCYVITECRKKFLLCQIELRHKRTVQKQPSTAIYFRKFLQKILVLESFFWSNFRLIVQSSDYILKWLHQKCYLGNLPLGLFNSAVHSHPFPKISP